MKVIGTSYTTATSPASDTRLPTTVSDLREIHRARTVTRRKARNPSLTRKQRFRAPGRRRSRPQTPLLKWKVEYKAKDSSGAVEDDDYEEDGCNDQGEREITRRKCPKKKERLVSVRKIAAGLRRLKAHESAAACGQRSRDRLGFQGCPAYIGAPFLYHQSNSVKQNPSYIAMTKSGFLCKSGPSIPFPHATMEAATKWDPGCLDTRDEVYQSFSEIKRIDQKVSVVSLVSELVEARARIEGLDNEKRSLKKKLQHFLRKASEEKAAWRSREHEKVRAIIDDMNREKKTRQRLEIVNAKLVNELADSKLAVKRCMRDYEKERKARELIEEVCDELAKEIEGDKAEIEAVKRESMTLRHEAEEERKMLQMAEVWREERVQMKLIDAKVALEEKYTQMNKLVEDLEAFLRSRNCSTDVEKVREAAISVNVKEIKDHIFSVFEDVSHDREIEQRLAYSPLSRASKVHTVSPEDESGWETISHLEEQGSSYSPDGSIASVGKHHRDSKVSMSCNEYEGEGYEDTPGTEISEVCSVPRRQSKKVSSIAKLWRSGGDKESFKIVSMEGMKGRVSNGRKSNVGISSPDRGSSKEVFRQLHLMGQWSSPDLIRGCIEWPRGAQKNSLKAKLLEARMERQRVQLKHVLKQNI